MVIILYAYINPSPMPPAVFGRWLSMLPASMTGQINLYRRWQDREAGLIGKVLLQKTFQRLGTRVSLEDVVYTDYKKPYLEAGPSFSISHSGDLIVCAASTSCSVGIDIELIKQISPSDFREQMTDNEWNKINRDPDPLGAFYRYWTEKESVIKANGKGLSIPLKEFEIESGKTVIDNDCWHVKTLALDKNYSCSLATNAFHIETEVIACHDIY